MHNKHTSLSTTYTPSQFSGLFILLSFPTCLPPSGHLHGLDRGFKMFLRRAMRSEPRRQTRITISNEYFNTPNFNNLQQIFQYTNVSCLTEITFLTLPMCHLILASKMPDKSFLVDSSWISAVVYSTDRDQNPDPRGGDKNPVGPSLILLHTFHIVPTL